MYFIKLPMIHTENAISGVLEFMDGPMEIGIPQISSHSQYFNRRVHFLAMKGTSAYASYGELQ